MPEECALAHAVDDALDYARRLVADHVQQQDRQAALDAIADAYAGNAYQLLRDLADALGASVAYVDRPTIEAHLERRLSDAEWAATVEQFTAMDFDDAVGDQGTFRTEWIETILERAGVPGRDSAADGVDNGEEPPGAA